MFHPGVFYFHAKTIPIGKVVFTLLTVKKYTPLEFYSVTMTIPTERWRLCMAYATQAGHYADKNSISATKKSLNVPCSMFEHPVLNRVSRILLAVKCQAVIQER